MQDSFSYNKISSAQLSNMVYSEEQSEPQESFSTVLSAWKDKAPIGEEREMAAQRIQDAYEKEANKLDLDNLKLSALPDCILSLTKLKQLSLIGNPLQALPKGLAEKEDLVISPAFYKNPDFILINTIQSVITEKIKTSHSIIPETELPFFIPKKREEYIKCFGEEKIAELENQISQLSAIRNKASEYKPQYLLDALIYDIACSLFGFGACGECSALALIKLVEAECKSPIHLVTLEGMPRAEDGKTRTYQHRLLLIGEVKQNNVQFNTLSTLNNTVILFDPFLQKIGQANKIHELIGDYLKTFGIDKVCHWIAINKEGIKKHNDTIMTTATQIHGEIKEKLEKEKELQQQKEREKQDTLKKQEKLETLAS